MKRVIDTVIQRLETLIRASAFEELETDTLEIKPVPPTGGEWRERYKSVNAFLNTRGGILILGIKEDGQGANRRYVFTGYRPDAESNIRELPRRFETHDKRQIDRALASKRRR